MRAARRLPRQHQRDLDVPRALRALRAALDADNAIERAAAGVIALAAQPPVPHAFDGLEFVEVASVTRIAGGIAANVIPDRVDCHVNFRYAPGRSAAEAEARLARAVRRPRRAADRLQRAVRAGRDGPRVDALVAAGDLVRAPKQAWTPVAEFGLARHPGRQLRPGRPRAGAPARRVASRSPRWPAPTRCWSGSRHEARPRADRPGDLPVRAPDRGQARAARRGRGPDRLRHRRAARGDAGLHPRGARRGAGPALHLSVEPTGCRSCAPRSPAGPRGASARRSTPTPQVLPTLGSKEAIFHLAQVLGGGRVAIPAPAYPVYERGALFAGKQALELPLREDAASCPTSTPSPPATWRDVASCGSTTRTTRPRRPRRSSSTSAPPRSRASTTSSGERRGLLGDLLRRRAAGLGAGAADLSGVLVFNTLSKRSSMPGYRSASSPATRS